VCFESLVTRIF